MCGSLPTWWQNMHVPSKDLELLVSSKLHGWPNALVFLPASATAL
jgi:hypothetical protein